MKEHRLRYIHLLTLLAAAGVLTLVLTGANLEMRSERQPLSASQVRELLAKSLPAWDESVLNAKAGLNWGGHLTYGEVFRALQDEPPNERDTPTGARRVADGARVARLDPRAGRVRYFNRNRAWTEDQAGAPLPDDRTAARTIRQTVAALGLPGNEFGRLLVSTQVAQEGAPDEAQTNTYELYKMVTFTRKVNGLPVGGSRVLGAVNARGAVQRLLVQWPAFDLAADLKLRSREDVISQVLQAILRQDPVPMSNSFLSAHLEYVPVSYVKPYKQMRTVNEEETSQAVSNYAEERAGEEADAKDGRYPMRRRHANEVVRYVPAVVFSVHADPTPYQELVPVAE